VELAIIKKNILIKYPDARDLSMTGWSNKITDIKDLLEFC